MKREWGVSVAAMEYHSNKDILLSDRKVKLLYYKNNSENNLHPACQAKYRQSTLFPDKDIGYA